MLRDPVLYRLGPRSQLANDRGPQNTHFWFKLTGRAFHYRKSQPFSALDNGMLVFGHFRIIPGDDVWRWENYFFVLNQWVVHFAIGIPNHFQHLILKCPFTVILTLSPATKGRTKTQFCPKPMGRAFCDRRSQAISTLNIGWLAVCHFLTLPSNKGQEKHRFLSKLNWSCISL